MVKHLQTEVHQIIIRLDNNEYLYASEGSIKPLQYQTNSTIRNTSHDGSLCTLAISCGLIDILSVHHSHRPFPPRGKNHIDYILISASLQSTVEWSGNLPYHTIFSGDHCPCFLDFNADLLFAGSVPPLALSCQMGLKLFDPRRILKYKEYLHKQLHYLNVFEKCKDLLELSQAKQWNQPQTDEYEKLDIIITLLFAKQSCSKKYQAL